MSLGRLTLTSVVLGALAALLAVLAPGIREASGVLADAQRVADTAGPDTVVLAAVALLAWGVWAWGALGLALTAAGALPGALGAAARLAVRVVLPAGARRAAAVTLGVGLALGSPLVAAASPPPAAVGSSSPAPDWPQAAPDDDPVPDWPGPRPGEHVVVRGDCLWDIAAAHLEAATGRTPSDGAVAEAVHAWWRANAEVIGADPDLLFPGQVLHPPALP